MKRQSFPLDLDQSYQRSRKYYIKPWAEVAHRSPAKALSATWTRTKDSHLPNPTIEDHSPPTMLSQLLKYQSYPTTTEICIGYITILQRKKSVR